MAEVGGARFGSALAYVTACRVRAAIVTVPDWAADVARLRATIDSQGALADLEQGGNVPRWWDSPPLAHNLREAAHAARDVPAVHDALRARFEDIFVAARPQTLATRTLEASLAPGVLRAVVSRRLRRLCPAISAAQADGALEAWRPALRVVGQYATHVFLRLPLTAWPTDARMHPADGARQCLLGCRGCPDDLVHYLSCVKLWRPILRGLGMDPSLVGRGIWGSRAGPFTRLPWSALGWRPFVAMS